MKKDTFILNGILILYWILLFLLSPFYPSIQLSHELFDAGTYLSSAEAYFHFQAGEFTDIRCWLASCFLWTIDFIGGAWLTFIVHTLFWLASANLIYHSVYTITNVLAYRIVAVVLFSLNVSLFYSSFLLLTEITCMFLLSLFLFSTVRAFKKGFTARYFIKMLFVFSILSVIKPVFWYPFLFILIVGIVIFAKTIFITNKKMMVWFFIALLPVVFQLTFMKIHHNVFNLSTIGGHTFTYYFVAQGIRKINGRSTSDEDIEYGRKAAEKMTKSEQIDFILNNKMIYTSLYLKNVTNNICDKVTINPRYKKPFVEKMSSFYNSGISFPLFLVFLLIFIVLFFVDVWNKKLLKHWLIYALGIMFYYIVFTSAISLWSGDRLTAYTIPIWIVLYILLYKRLSIKSWFKKKNLKKL